LYKLNDLEKEAIKLFGKNWESADDVEQIKKLLIFVGQTTYDVDYLEGTRSDYNMKVYDCWKLDQMEALGKQRDELLEALKLMVKNTSLNKLNIKKDFSLINAHANATRIIGRERK